MARAQLYIFAALLFIIGIFVIYANSSSISVNEIEDFQQYLDNYINEARLVMNSALYYNRDITNDLRNFTENYISYTSNKGISIGIVFIYSRDNSIHIVNYIKEPILISTEIVPSGSEHIISFTDELEIMYKNITYTYSFTPEKTEIKTLFVKQNE